MKKKYLQVFVLVAVCLTVVLMIRKDEKQNKLSEKEEIQELTWFSDIPEWEPNEWNTDSESATGKITEMTGIQINYLIPEDNGDGRLSLMLINRNIPDILSISDEKMIRHLVQAGEVWNLEELLRTYLPDSHLLSDYPEDIKNELINRDGGWFGLAGDLHSPDNQKEYGMPEEFYRLFQKDSQEYGIIWNKALLKRLGLSAGGPRTESEVLQAFQMIEDREITVNGTAVIPLLVDGSRYQDTSLEVLYSFFGAYWLDEEGTYQLRIGTEEGKHALRFLNDSLRNGYMSSDQFMMNSYNIQWMLNSGQVLCFIGDILHSGIDPKDWVSSGAILSDDGKKPVLGVSNGIDCGKMTTFVSKSCENPEAAAIWLDYITSTEGMNDYLEANDGKWWPLMNEDWYYATRKTADEDTRAWAQLLCAAARMPETVIYDKSMFDFPLAGGHIRELETEVNESMKEHLNTVIVAETTEEFEKAYEDMMDALESAGIRELEQYRERMLK